MSNEPPEKKSGFDFQWVFTFSILFGGFFLMTRPATNNKVLIFRISLVVIGVVGLVATTIIKHKRASNT